MWTGTSTATMQVPLKPFSLGNDTTNPDPDVYPNTPQPTPSPVVRPAWHLAARPRPHGSGERGKGGARDVLAVWTPASRARPGTPAPRRPSPASWAGPSPRCRLRAPPLDSLLGGSLRGGGGRRLTRRPLSGFPSPPLSIRRQRRPGSAPGSRSGRKAPGPKPAPTARPTLGFPSFSLP